MILTFPNIIPASVSWGLTSNTELFSSPLTGSVQTTERPGARWKATLAMPPLEAINAGALDAFMAQLGGRSGRFYLYPHHRSTPNGAGGSGTVVAGGQTGKVLATSGWAAGARIMRAGDFFQVGSELKMLTADATADGSGNCTLQFMPPLRSSPASGGAIVTTHPKAVMMLDADDFSTQKQPGPATNGLVIACTEAF